MPKIAVLKETREGEKRVAIVPSIASKLAKIKDVEVLVEHDAGKNIYAADDTYKEATIVENAQTLCADADIVIKIQPPTDAEIDMMKEGTILISSLYPHSRPEVLKKLCAKKVTAFALEMIPRISRAQSMDILSSQATVSGYKAVLLAASIGQFFFPMFSTAAGTVRPANVLIMGAGVAGLQAIATAKRLGARVSAFDVREATKEEVESLGAKFVDTGVKATGEGGYARELTAEEKKQQQDALAKVIAASDVIITTAGVPGKPAPKIISKVMLETMKPGSIIVDTMAEMGGNCELAKAGQNVVHNDVTIVGTKNITSSVATHASEMFARNVYNFLTPILETGELKLDWEDEVIVESVATHAGSVVNDALKKLVEE